ncbi:hypothetical protein [Methylobacterium sp. WL7]|nr:hypothetical protein [Methylobacterium sp. WL7]
MPSQTYKIPADVEVDSTDKDRQRDGIDIKAEGQQFVAYGKCPGRSP